MFRGEGYHAEDNEYENVREGMKNPIGSNGFVDIDSIPVDNDPLNVLLEAEKAATEDDEDIDEIVIGSSNDSASSSTERYVEHGVATGDEAEVTDISTSGEFAPKTPRLKKWFGLRRDNKRDDIRGKEDRK